MKKRVATGLLLLLLCFLAPLTASAESVDSLTVDVKLDEDGAAHVTEVWEIDATKGTEWYLNKDNMGDMAVTDFSVSDETGAQYTNEGAWDVDRSREEKAGKCGVVSKANGYELCWGLGEYGQRTYTARYTMTNFVKSYTDYDGFNVRFLNDQMSSAPERVDVTIRAPQELTPEETGVWAFGFSGEIYVEDGVVHAWSNDPLTDSNHVTVMVRFEKGVFTPSSTRDEPFSVLEDQALEGSDYTPDYDGPPSGDADRYGKPRKPINFAALYLPAFVFILFIAGLIVFIFVATTKAGSARGGAARACVRSISLNEKEIPFHREIPCNGSLPAAYALLKYTGGSAADGAVIGAYLLRWTYRRLVRIDEVEKKGFLGFGGGVQPSIVFSGDASTLNGVERALYEMMREASGSDGILQEKEFYKWSQRHYKAVEAWTDNMEREGHAILEGLGAIEMVPVKRFFGLIETQEASLTTVGCTLAQETAGFKKYLREFTIINERRAVEVELWDEYLVFATLFGIADEVAKEFKSLYPQYFERPEMGYGTSHDVFWTMLMINSMSRAAARGAAAGRSAAEARSSGGGGFSSGGGGGGFSGGGSGGGSR